MKKHKGIHESQNSSHISGLSGGCGGPIRTMNVLDLLSVPVQNEKHGDAGADYESQMPHQGTIAALCVVTESL